MRIRKLIVGTAVASLTVVGFSAVASAQDTETTEPLEPVVISENPADGDEGDVGEEIDNTIEEELGGEGEEEEVDEVAECLIEAGEGGTDPSKCYEAPNPILPETTEIIWGGIAFVVLLGFMWKFGLPPIKQGMADRSERIRTDLDKAEEAKVEAAQTLEQYHAQLTDAKAEANRIIEEARQSADSLKAELKQRADAEIAEMKQRAAADVEAAKTQAIADLQADVATLAIGAAELVVEKNLDQATQVELIENYINQVGAGR